MTEAQLLELVRKYLFINRLEKHEITGPIFTRARGSLIWDMNGMEYIDFNSGQMCSALGHNHPHIIAAIQRACETVMHCSSTFFNEAEILLAAKVAAMSVEPLVKSFFLASGSDSNEAAMVMAKKVTGGYEIASPHISFHGLADSPRAVTHAAQAWRKGYGPYAPGHHAIFAPYCYRCPLHLEYPSCNLACVDASFELLDAESTGHLAAVITEPLFSAGGVIEAPPGWLKKVQDETHKRGALLILDENQTGLAKLGSFYSFTQQEGVMPDIVTLAKHFGGGVEVSAVVSTAGIEENLLKQNFVYAHSHTSDPLGCRAALASLEVIEQENLYEKSQQIGQYWHGHLKQLEQRHEVVGDVRGRGLLQGVEFVKDRKSKAPFFGAGARVAEHCRKHGLLMSVRRNGSVLRFVPPFTTTNAQMDRAAEILDGALKQL